MARQLPDSWIFSDKLIKRAFGVFGHYVLAVLLIYVALLPIIFIFAMFSAIFA